MSGCLGECTILGACNASPSSENCSRFSIFYFFFFIQFINIFKMKETKKKKQKMTQRLCAAAHVRWPEVDPKHKYWLNWLCVRMQFPVKSFSRAIALSRKHINCRKFRWTAEITTGKQKIAFMVNDLFSYGFGCSKHTPAACKHICTRDACRCHLRSYLHCALRTSFYTLIYD